MESEIDAYQITILPPWYRTVWAYIIYLIFLVTIIWLIVRLNSRRLKTANIHLEKTIKERTCEITIQKEEIKAKRDELQIANVTKDKFFSIIAHDLRGPLGGFMRLTEMIEDESINLSPDQKKELISTLSQSSKNIYNLLENLLEWSQMQKGNIPFSPQLLDLKKVVIESTKTIDELARKKNIVFTVSLTNDQKVFADIHMLRTIILNLASNAVKFTKQNGTISISAKPDGDQNVMISVADNGIGMSNEMLDELFIPGADSRRKGTDGEPSTGLGLLLCKELVEKQTGKLWAESEVGKGSTFSFTIPFSSKIADKKAVVNVFPSSLKGNKIENLKILIAEDDETSEMLISIALKSISKEILKARTGYEAVEICKSNPDIDLIMMDIKMPGMDGYEATRQIRQFNKDVFIVAQTAFGKTGDSERAISEGFNDFLSKPLSLALLRELIVKNFTVSE